MSTLSRLRLKTPPKVVSFYVGQRVRISAAGRDGMYLMPGKAATGTIAESVACYPGSIAVVRDGAKSPLSYHPSYWEPA